MSYRPTIHKINIITNHNQITTNVILQSFLVFFSSNAESNEAMEPIPELVENSSLSLKDEIVRLPVIKYGGKLRSSSLAVGRGQELRVSVLSTHFFSVSTL